MALSRDDSSGSADFFDAPALFEGGTRQPTLLMEAMAVRNHLRIVRALHRVSLRKLSAAVGIETTRLWSIENGYRDATETERAAISSYFGVTDRDILWKSEPASRQSGGAPEAIH